MTKLLTVEQVAELGYDYEIVDRELRIFYRGDVVTFQWPTSWSPALMRWHILYRLELRNPDLLPPPASQCYNV